MDLTATKCPSTALGLTNCVIVHPDDVARLPPPSRYVRAGRFVFPVRASDEVKAGCVGLTKPQRAMLDVSVTRPADTLTLVGMSPDADSFLSQVPNHPPLSSSQNCALTRFGGIGKWTQVTLVVSTHGSKNPGKVDTADLAKAASDQLPGFAYNVGQELLVKLGGVTFVLKGALVICCILSLFF